MRDCLVHRQVVERRLLAGDDHIHIVAAAQAMVSDRQQTVRVRRQVHAHDLCLLVDHMVDEPWVLVGEPVVVLAPNVRGEQIVQRCHRRAPLRVLIEHRVDDVDERLVAVQQTMPTRQQVALQPALAEMLAQDLHHTPVGREVIVAVQTLGVPRAVRDLEHGAQAVGCRLVRTHDAQVRRVGAERIAQERAEHPRGLADARRRRGHRDGVVTEVGQLEIAQQRTAVGVRVGAHAPLTLGREGRQLRPERAILVKQLLGAVGAKPLLELTQVLGIPSQVGERNLMGAKRPLRRQPVDHLRAGPALGGAQHDGRPGRPGGGPSRARRWISAISAVTSSKVAAMSWCIAAGSSPSTKRGA